MSCSAPFSDKAHAYAAKALEKKGVVLKLGASVTAVEADRAVFADGSHILSRCVVWAGGLKAREISGLETLPERSRPDQRRARSRRRGLPRAVRRRRRRGGRRSDGKPFPQLGSVALQAGGAVAKSIVASIDGKPAPPFKYHDKGIMAMIGHGAAVAEMGKHHHELHGSVAFAAWLGVHAWLLNTTRARIDAFINWAWDSFSNNRGPGDHRRSRRPAHRLGRRRCRRRRRRRHIRHPPQQHATAARAALS